MKQNLCENLNLHKYKEMMQTNKCMSALTVT